MKATQKIYTIFPHFGNYLLFFIIKFGVQYLFGKIQQVIISKYFKGKHRLHCSKPISYSGCCQSLPSPFVGHLHYLFLEEFIQLQTTTSSAITHKCIILLGHLRYIGLKKGPMTNLEGPKTWTFLLDPAKYITLLPSGLLTSHYICSKRQDM